MHNQDDSNSFIYFSISIMTIVLGPLSYYVLKHPLKTFILKSYRKNTLYQMAPLHKSSDLKIQADMREQKFQWFNSSYVTKLFIWVILSLVLINAFQQLPDIDTLGIHDPYDIIGVSHTASQADIRKAYRKLALAYHPDKSVGKEKDFLRVTKAFECLENPKKLDNCKRFGNPEGHSGNYQVSLAMPSFLMESEHQGLLLFVLFGLFFGCIFIVLYQFFVSFGKFDENKVLSSNLTLYRTYFKEDRLINLEGCFEMISDLEEFQKIAREDILAILDRYYIKGELAEKDKEMIIRLTPLAIQSAISFGLQVVKSQQKGIPKASISSQILQCLSAQQQFIQGRWADKKLNPTLYPQIEVEVKLTHFDPDLKPWELTSTDQFIIQYKILSAKDPQLVFSEIFPFLREHTWLIFLIMDGEIKQFKIVKESKIIQGEFRLVPYFYSQKVDQQFYNMKVLIMSDSYVGYDKSIDVEIRCKTGQISSKRKDSSGESSEEDDHDDYFKQKKE